MMDAGRCCNCPDARDWIASRLSDHAHTFWTVTSDFLVAWRTASSAITIMVASTSFVLSPYAFIVTLFFNHTLPSSSTTIAAPPHCSMLLASPNMYKTLTAVLSSCLRRSIPLLVVIPP